MLEQFIKAVGSEFTFTQSSAIIVLVWLFFQERKDKVRISEKHAECMQRRTEDAKQHAEQMSDVTRTLDKVLMSKGVIPTSEVD